MTLQSRTQALLDLVEADRAQRCGALLEQARSQAQAALAQARRQARERMRETFAEERERATARIAAAQAELQTRRRLQAQHRAEALLALAWQRLPQVLLARWQDPSQRARWVQAALQSAQARLPEGRWTVRHPPDWPAQERASIVPQLRSRSTGEPALQADPSIVAGLRLAANGNVVDATLAGLLADRDEIGGRLIGLLEAAQVEAEARR